ncbi:alpha/beta-hydrolase [Viridothelium virens]|uniref:Alpha/beta-hydrolase n=1 Tax=Viridothelium virens TaxID=1048519 RepID=A0A6A6GZI3_VIRVR|nr:alpha/beta-hydrolase [Viridothelium virens]
MSTANPRPTLLLGSVAGVAAASVYSLLCLYRAISAPASPNAPKNIPSPRTALLPSLSEEEIQSLPYPPDVFPGARDVDTPYGSIRAYEWGPEDGRKVLLVHGISTPCISLAGVAEKLVEQGCRVMLFDLFGRGYSSCPATLPHDIRLYTTQIFLVLASSPLSWTGSASTSTKTDRFTLVGYSLGGCISLNFTATFPHLVSDLVLIAPAGLIRDKHVAWQSRLLYSRYGGLVPESWVSYIVARRLRAGPTGATAVSPHKKSASSSSPSSTLLPTDATIAPITAEVANTTPSSTIHPSSASHSAPPSGSSFDNAILFPNRPKVSVAATVSWQLKHHPGFLPAFISCIRYCPIYRQEQVWKTIGSRLDTIRRAEGKAGPVEREGAGHTSERKWSLESRVLVIAGKTDSIIVPEELRDDAGEAIGKQNLDFITVEAGHEAPITRSGEIVDAMRSTWEKGLG